MTVCLGDFAESAKPISATMPLSQVAERFLNDPQAQYYILVRDKRPAGLISRTMAFEFAASAAQDKQSRLAIGDLITAKALIIKAETTVGEFVARAGKQIDAVIARGCIIVEDKRFKGVLSPAKLQQALIATLDQPDLFDDDEPKAPALVKSKLRANETPLLGTLAHEIRTPLTAIMGLSEMLASRVRNDHQKDLAQTIVRSSHTLDRILTDTLDYARLEAGKLNVRREAADLTELTDDLRRLWGSEAARRSLALRVSFIPDGPHHVQTDCGRVRQIANNLISNALKFTKEGEVSVTLSTQPMGGALMLVLSVTDTGRGLTSNQRDRFMEVFEKGPEIDGVKGWGLGLTISRALATGLGGELTHADNPHGGSVFTLRIPVEQMVKKSAKQAEPATPKRGKFELGDVLLVEDHEASAMIVINALEQAGWTVHHAGTLHSAESYVALTKFQAVITDLHLPDGNSMSFIDNLRRQGGLNASTPVIALTADTTESRRQSCLSVGADRAMKKPVTGPELVATIADVLMSRAAGHASTGELRGRLAS